MPMIERTESASEHTWTKPTLVVREIPDDETKSNRGGGQGLVGEIRDDLIPMSYSDEPGPVGGTLQLRWKDKLWMQTEIDPETHEDFRGSTFTLEQRRSLSNRAVQEVLFRGKLASQSKEYADNVNGINLNIRDWFVYADAPIAMPTTTFSGPLTAGALFAAMDNGYFQVIDFENGLPQSKIRTFSQYPWPLDSDGNRIAAIDPELLALKTKPGSVALTGQPLAQAFADVLRKVSPNLIPSIRYDGAFTYLYGIRRGAQEKELVVNAVGQASPTASVKCTCMRIEGSEDYSNLYNSAHGVGGLERKIEVFELEKGWTDDEETLVKATPTLLSTYQYQHVGRRYLVPRKAFWVAGVPHGPSAFKSDRVKAARRQTDAGLDFQYSEMDIEQPKEQRGILRKGTAVDRLEVHPDDASMAVVYFKAPQTYYYYTQAQEANRVAGTAVGTPTVGFYDWKVEAVSPGLPLNVYHAADTDYPRFRTIQVYNPNAIKYTYVSHIEIEDDNSISESTTAPESLKTPDTGAVRDDSGFLLEQIQNIIQESARPDINFSAEMWHFDPSWKKGDRITRIRDTTGFVLYDNLEWYVESVYHDLQRWTTLLRLSSAYQELSSRQLIV